ncbi:MAG TPA: hypothetical protein VFC02_10485 [Anaerolineales bacterium]|nr:hypothetical protein [Anaerolineales bacterium]
MQSAKTALILTGLFHFVLAVGFFFQQAWTKSLWPVPDTRLSYAFIAAILAGGGAPLIWAGLSGKLASLAGYGISFGIMYAGMGISALLFYLRDRNPALVWFAFVMGVLAVAGGIIFMRSRPIAENRQPTPQIVIYAVLNRQWIHALGPLLGFLVYDLVLFSPLFARFGNLQPEHIRGQVAASVIIIFSAALGIYYLFVNSATRLGTRSG